MGAIRRSAYKVEDGAGRQVGLGDEADRRTPGDHVREIFGDVGGDQYHRRGRLGNVKLFGHVEAALAAEFDVNQCDVGMQRGETPRCFLARGGHADDGDALMFE